MYSGISILGELGNSVLSVLSGVADHLFPFFRSEAEASSILSFILYHYAVPLGHCCVP